jgi:hypothetical protein
MLARGQDGLGLKLGMHLYRLLGWLFIRLPSIFGSEAPSFKIKSVSRISVFSRVTGICTAQIRLRSFYPEATRLVPRPHLSATNARNFPLLCAPLSSSGLVLHNRLLPATVRCHQEYHDYRGVLSSSRVIYWGSGIRPHYLDTSSRSRPCTSYHILSTTQ